MAGRIRHAWLPGPELLGARSIYSRRPSGGDCPIAAFPRSKLPAFRLGRSSGNGKHQSVSDRQHLLHAKLTTHGIDGVGMVREAD